MSVDARRCEAVSVEFPPELRETVAFRRHGCELPLNIFQAGGVFVHFICTSVTVTYLLALFDPNDTFLAIALLGVGLHFFTTVSYLVTTFTDTTDDAINLPEDETLQLFCDLCNSRVHDSSKHCRACRKCVIGFDHHCVWLNCCIGERNYWQFFTLLIFALMLLTFQAGVNIATLTRIIRGFEVAQPILLLPGSSSLGKALLATALAINSIGALLLLDLLLFHIILRIKGLATFDYFLASQVSTKKKLGISICRLLRTTSEAGKLARWRHQRGKIVPLPEQNQSIN